MSLLIETMKCKDGKICNIHYHNLRFNKARKDLFGLNKFVDLAKEIPVPQSAKSGLFKCRIVYSEEIEKTEFVKHEYRKIESLKLMEDDEIDYHYKFSDRNRLNRLFNNRGICDDILVVKEGYITDSFTANVIFFDGEKWWTPTTPLLRGTQRERLLAEGKIFERPIKPHQILEYKMAGLINAMQDLNKMPMIPIQNII